VFVNLVDWLTKSLNLRINHLQLQPYEIPRFVHIFDEEFSMHNELLTATLKNCRPKLKEKFKHVLNKRYREMEALSTQRRLQQILSQTMGLSDEGDGTLAATSSFVEMGGDSLVAVKLVETMRAQFKVRVLKAKMSYHFLDVDQC
jgi:hypothetical protein